MLSSTGSELLKLFLAEDTRELPRQPAESTYEGSCIMPERRCQLEVINVTVVRIIHLGYSLIEMLSWLHGSTSAYCFWVLVRNAGDVFEHESFGRDSRAEDVELFFRDYRRHLHISEVFK